MSLNNMCVGVSTCTVLMSDKCLQLLLWQGHCRPSWGTWSPFILEGNAEFQLEVGDCTVFISFLSELTESLSPGAQVQNLCHRVWLPSLYSPPSLIEKSPHVRVSPNPIIAQRWKLRTPAGEWTRVTEPRVLTPGPDAGPAPPPPGWWQGVQQEQVGSWCPARRVTRPRLRPASRPGRHSWGCDRRLGSDSPRHIPGPATNFFFFFFGDSFSHTPNPHPPFPQKCSVSPQRVPLGGGSWREMRPGFPGTLGAGVPALGGGKLLAAEHHPAPQT